MTVYKIGELSKETGIDIETIRYYEKIGLIPEPKRSDKNYRQYDSNYISSLHFITHTKKLGFSLKEIQRFLNLRMDNHTNCSDIKCRIDQKIASVEQKIKQLNEIHKSLKAFSTQCSDTENIENQCAFLDTFYIKKERLT